MKKLLILLVCCTSHVIAQQLPLFEEAELNQKSLKNRTSFEAITHEAEVYFSTRDVDKKGSGFKPFKRWEYHWKHYLQEDGAIAPSSHLWQAWEQKNKMAKSSSGVSNWTDKGPFDQTSKSGQGRINAVMVDPNNSNTIYVGAPAGGIWKSTDNGVNWIPLTDDLPQIGVSGIAIDPNNSNIIYISTGDDDGGASYSIGVLKSTDGGSTWNSTGAIAGSPTSSNEIVIDPTNSNKIWVATSNGLFLSTNAGVSWDQKQSGHIRDFKLKPGNPNTIYAVSSNTYYRSTDGGTSFQTIATGLPASNSLGRLRVEVTPASPNNVYILAVKTNWGFEGVYTSSNSGTSFSKTLEEDDIFGSTQAWFDLAFCISDSNANELFVGVLDIWKSTTAGNNFTKINQWFNPAHPAYTHADIHFMRYFDGVLYAGTDGGVYRSTDNGATFTSLTENLSISQFYRISVSKQNSSKLAGGLQDNGGFSLSSTTWNKYHGGDGMDAASDPNDENTFYGFSQFGGTLNVTNDGGLTSTTIAEGPTQGNWVTPLVVTKSSDIYAGYTHLYKIQNGEWQQISNTFFEGKIDAMEIDPSNNNNIFVSNGLTLYISNDKGATFTSRNSSQTGLSGVNISSIEVHNSNSNIVWVTTTGVFNNTSAISSGHSGGGVYKSTDGGQTFTDITSGLPRESKFVVRHHPFSGNNSIYVGTALGVYHRNDDTNSWEVFSTNLPNVAVTDLEINPYDNTITAATYGRSVWQSPIPQVTQPTDEAELIAIASPKYNDVCANIVPAVKVLNNGTNPITSLTLSYNIDGNANQIFNWTGTINANTQETITLPVIGASEGAHTLNVELSQANDANLFNNAFSSTFEVDQASGLITYTFGDSNPTADENNESWNASSLWQIGTPTTTNFNNLVNSGYVTNPSGNYSNNTVAYLTSPCYNMTTIVNPVLKFDMAFDIELNWDVLYMEYSTDQGATWSVLGTADDPNWYNSSFQDPGRVLTIGKQWTGTDASLKEYSYDLNDFSNESSIMFRFVFKSDPGVNQEGVLIDNFIIDATQVLGTDELDASNFAIYPNPSENIFNIMRNGILGEKMDILVYDLTGKLILNRTNIFKNEYPLDMSTISKGVYFMKINIENKSLVKKLILK